MPHVGSKHTSVRSPEVDSLSSFTSLAVTRQVMLTPMRRLRKTPSKAQTDVAQLWLIQAKEDVRYAKSALKDGFFSQVCFLSQQIAEKSIKSVILRTSKAFPFSHSLVELVGLAQINGKLAQAAIELDQYYVTARYPTGIGGLAPFQLFGKEQATRALKLATLFVSKASLGKLKSKR